MNNGKKSKIETFRMNADGRIGKRDIYLQAVMAVDNICFFYCDGVLFGGSNVEVSYKDEKGKLRGFQLRSDDGGTVEVSMPFCLLPMETMEEVAQQYHRAKCELRHLLLAEVTRLILAKFEGELATA